ncbi:MAG TPA: protein kinase [Rhodocyclaceae bacterium]
MAKILIVDDDSTVCNLTRAYLAKGGHETVVAQDGVAGLIAAFDHRPDMVLCDVNMPNLDGFGLLAALRKDGRTARTPFVFITANEDRDSLRKALRHGAEDYLVKPVKPHELNEVVSERLAQVNARQGAAEREFAETARFEGAFSLEATRTAAKRETRTGTVLYCDIRNFTTFSEILEPAEVAEMLHKFFSKACEPLLRQEGWIVEMLGDAVLAMFEPGGKDDHAGRALRAALLMVLAATKFQAWLDHRFKDRGLPPFAVGVGVHGGEVMVCDTASRDRPGPTIVGDTVNVAARLQNMTKELGWSVVASAATVAAAGQRFEREAPRTVSVRGRSAPIEIVGVTGLKPRADAREDGLAVYHDIRRAVVANNAAIRAGVAGADPAATLPRIDGYRMREKIGEGGMSSVYLAESEQDGSVQVVKIMPIVEDGDPDALQRFIHEYALVSQVKHRNVGRIYQQGFTASSAYIAMEYLPGDDLRAHIGEGLAPATALDYLLQAAAALEAVHAMGIIHRDIKPANLMLRADGSLALVDFGISKTVEANLSATQNGEIVGTPYYLSPEQVRGQPLDARTDIYSLGGVFHEMLTGRRPYGADTIDGLLAQHLSAPVPTLPVALAQLQELLDRMMAKNPADRFGSATELRRFIADLGRQPGAPGRDGLLDLDLGFDKTQPIAVRPELRASH